jgi:MoxR-like ATPase
MATQNPIEMEGTYPLPEAQLDRFLMKILVKYPVPRRAGPHRRAHHPEGRETTVPVLDRDSILEVRSVCREVLVAPHVQDYAIALVMATQPEQKEAHEARQEICPLRQFAARRAGAGGMRTRAGADARPLPSEHGRM